MLQNIESRMDKCNVFSPYAIIGKDSSSVLLTYLVRIAHKLLKGKVIIEGS